MGLTRISPQRGKRKGKTEKLIENLLTEKVFGA
jgi:hypothetical protein